MCLDFRSLALKLPAGHVTHMHCLLPNTTLQLTQDHNTTVISLHVHARSVGIEMELHVNALVGNTKIRSKDLEYINEPPAIVIHSIYSV